MPFLPISCTRRKHSGRPRRKTSDRPGTTAFPIPRISSSGPSGCGAETSASCPPGRQVGTPSTRTCERFRIALRIQFHHDEPAIRQRPCIYRAPVGCHEEPVRNSISLCRLIEFRASGTANPTRIEITSTVTSNSIRVKPRCPLTAHGIEMVTSPVLPTYTFCCASRMRKSVIRRFESPVLVSAFEHQRHKVSGPVTPDSPWAVFRARSEACRYRSACFGRTPRSVRRGSGIRLREPLEC